MSFVKAQWIAGLLAVALLQITPAKAETFNTCAGFIESLPATISTQGVWCLKKDLTTAMTNGSAITIATNNVTIDCNDFKIGGLAAGTGSTAVGIFSDKQNSTVRHCAVRGFLYGIQLVGAGHLVEDNRLDQNLHMGIVVGGDNNRVQRNGIYDTGGSPNSATSCGIYGSADVLDNTVAGVFGAQGNGYVYGICAFGYNTEIRGNQVRDLVVPVGSNGRGIYGVGGGLRISNNHIATTAATAGYGIYSPGSNTFCTGNTVINFGTGYNGCDYAIGNLPTP